MAGEIPGRQPLPGRQGVVPSDDEGRRLAAEDPGLDPLDAATGEEQPEIEVAVAGLLDRLIKRPNVGDDLDAWIRMLTDGWEIRSATAA